MKWIYLLNSLIAYQGFIKNDSYKLSNSDLIPVDNNDKIYIYKRETKLNDHSVYLTQYFFSLSRNGTIVKLTTENLLVKFSREEFFMELKLFLSKGNLIELDEYGHLKLFAIINSRAAHRTYEILLRDAAYREFTIW